jgi:hypothetical protein
MARDLTENLKQGDMTEIGDKGDNLSGRRRVEGWKETVWVP